MSKKINPTDTDGASDPLTPGDVALLMRVVRAHIIPEADLVSSWGTGPWAAKALDRLLKGGLVRRREGVSVGIGDGRPSDPATWIASTRAGKSRMSKELPIAFPPSGNWLSFADVRVNFQPPDLLMQLLEYFLVRDGLMELNAGVELKPAEYLLEQLLVRLSEINQRYDDLASPTFIFWGQFLTVGRVRSVASL